MNDESHDNHKSGWPHQNPIFLLPLKYHVASLGPKRSMTIHKWTSYLEYICAACVLSVCAMLVSRLRYLYLGYIDGYFVHSIVICFTLVLNGFEREDPKNTSLNRSNFVLYFVWLDRTEQRLLRRIYWCRRVREVRKQQAIITNSGRFNATQSGRKSSYVHSHRRSHDMIMMINESICFGQACWR